MVQGIFTITIFNTSPVLFQFLRKLNIELPWCPGESLSHAQLCDLMDCRSPGFSVHGVLQARILEWVAI